MTSRPAAGEPDTEVRAAHAHVLLVDPDHRRAGTTRTSLRERGYTVDVVDGAAMAMQYVESSAADVILLSLDLPDVEGADLCAMLRVWVRCPIVVLAAAPDDERIIAALDNGADDAVVAPFSHDMLAARIRVALRHGALVAATVDGELLVCGDVQLDLGAHQARFGDVEVELQPRQFTLLATLMRNAGRMVPHSQLARVLWGRRLGGADLDRLRAAVSVLRKRLGEGPHRPVIETATTLGYRLVPPS